MTRKQYIKDKLTSFDIYYCARTMYGEVRGESKQGKYAFMEVIFNRALDKKNRWPKTLEEVCLQPKQFSCWNGNTNMRKLLSLTLEGREFRDCFKHVLLWLDYHSGSHYSLGANHYLTIKLADSKPPSWYDPKKVTVDIGNHRFLKL